MLLLGGTGFIGANLASELRRAGHEVLVAGRAEGAGVLALPLGDVDAVAALVADRRVDTVVHLASATIPSSSESQYLAEQVEIALPTMALAGRLAEAGVLLAYVSSGGTVYGSAARTPAAEDDPCAPISFYGQSKRATELYLQFAHRTRGLNYLIVRPSNPFGPGQSLRAPQGLVAVALGCLRDARPLEVWGDGSSVRDYIYVDDFVASVRELIEGGVQNTTVNVGSGTGHSLLDVVAAVEEVTGGRVELDFRPARAADVPRLVLDVGRLRALGMHRARPLRDGVRAYAAALGMTRG